jgi:hypothetical protein
MGKMKTGVFLLGCRGAGKTSFLTGLSLLSEAGKASSFQAMPKDSPSARMLRDLRIMAYNGQWPPPTSTNNLLDFELTYKKRIFNIFFLDSPGEDLQEVMETLDFSTREKIHEHARNSSYVLVIADPTQDLITPVNVTSEPVTKGRQNALAQGLSCLADIRKEADKPLPDVAVVLSKDDLLHDSGGVDTKVEQDNGGFFTQLQKYSKNSQRIPIFPLSVRGYGQPEPQESFPKSPTPTGYEALFDWMGDRDVNQRYGRTWFLSRIAILVTAGIVGGYLYWDHHQATSFERYIEHASLENVQEAVAQRDVFREGWLRALDVRAAREMDAVDARIQLVTTDEAYKRLDDTLALLGSMHHLAQNHRLRDLRDRIEHLRESSLFASITAAVRAGEQQEALRLIADYRQRFPTGGNTQGIADMEQALADEQRSSLRGRVHSIPVTDRSSLAVKIGEIRRYLGAYPDDPSAKQIQTALRVAEQLTATDAVRLLMTGCGFGGAAGDRRHEIRWANGRGEDLQVLFRQDSKVSLSTFTEYMEVDHARWNAIRIELWSTPVAWFDKLMATSEFHILRDAHLFNGERRIPLRTNTDEWRDIGGWVRMHIQLRGTAGWQSVPPDDLEAYGRYILPGAGWR